MNAQLLTGIFTLGAATVGFWGIRYTQRQQAQQQELQRQRDREKDYLADARALRDTKRERLRESYATVIDTGWQISSMTELAVEAISDLGSGDEDQRWEALRQDLAPALATAQRFHTLLVLEADAADFNAVFREVVTDAKEVRSLFTKRNNVMGGPLPSLPLAILERHERLVAGIGRMEELARDHLSAIDKPLPAPEVDSAPLARALRGWELLKFWQRSRRDHEGRGTQRISSGEAA